MTVHRSFVKSATKSEETPLMKQYYAIKAKYPDALLLFRVGDFYETFGEDAVKTSGILGIVLTKRANGAASHIELAGFPHHALDTYLPKLVRAGQRVAICDQLEDPKLAKTVVKRGVTELVTPGTAISEKIIENKSNNFLAVIFFGENQTGISFIDVSTGEFLAAQGNNEYIENLLGNFNPSEVIVPKKDLTRFSEMYGNRFYTYHLDEWVFQLDNARKNLLRHFETNSLKGFGVEEMDDAVIAAGAAIHYLAQNQYDHLKHVTSLSRIEEDKYVWLDKFTIRNLELVSSPHDKAATLLGVLDKTRSPMGARLLRRWILLPLKEIKPVEERLEAVNHMLHRKEFSETISDHISAIGDLERLIGKAAVKKISPREVNHLRKALHSIEPVKSSCLHSGNEQLKLLGDRLNPCIALRDKIEKTVVDNAPATAAKGGMIKEGVNAELDDLRNISHTGKEFLLHIQKRESEKTNITSLKVGFNSVFGYYIEVTNAHKNKVPSDWIRKQTLTNAERYITSELKEYEEKILGADEKIIKLEEEIFNNLIAEIADYIQPLQNNSAVIARLDCLLSLASAAEENNYVRPHINDSLVIDIKKGRHPVLEKRMTLGEEYVPNDIYLDSDTQQILVITGPNMSGKSALLRQTALIVLMAQMGSFVPAHSAGIGIADKIFTRVGASDNISSGESTFMVEMNETASILNNISERSLVLMDEIGRGTSTYDGISIAWAIAEFIHDHPSAKAKTLFATHYHELNELESQKQRIKNYKISVKETGSKVIFLRKLVPGGSEHSFGIHVAKMAGIPVKVVHRANEMLQVLEKAHSGSELSKNKAREAMKEAFQLSFIQLDDPALEQIREEILKVDINTLTPVEALMKLNEIKKLLKQ